MKKSQMLMSSVFMLCLAALWLATSRTAIEATPGNVKQVAPGVWFREGEIKDKGHCNNIWIEMKDYLIVVDANFPSGAEACLADIKRQPRSLESMFLIRITMATMLTGTRCGRSWEQPPSRMSEWLRR
jgi:hypothetical protein